MERQYLTKNVSETRRLGKVLAEEILKIKPKEHALVVSMVGELGSGKTAFSQGFAMGLGVRQRTLSPTFIIARRYPIQTPRIFFKYFYHIDCYRLKKADEISATGFEDLVSRPENIVLIEWADKIENNLPKSRLQIFFRHIDKNSRQIILKV